MKNKQLLKKSLAVLVILIASVLLIVGFLNQNIVLTLISLTLAIVIKKTSYRLLFANYDEKIKIKRATFMKGRMNNE